MTVPLATIVASFLDDSNIGQAEYAKAYRVAIRGLKDISWDITGQVKTEPIVFDADRTALIPLDCVKILEFGVANGNGGIASFDEVQDFNSYPYDNNFDTIFDYHNNIPFGNYFNPENRSYGLGSHNCVGQYKIDKKLNKIFIAPNTASGTFLIKYTSYQNENCEYVVDTMATEALVAYIRWKFSMSGTRNTLQVQDVNRREYYREKGNLKMRLKKPTLSAMNKSSRESTKMSIRS